MSEAEYLIRELIAGLESVIVRKTIPDDLQNSLDRCENWLIRQGRQLAYPRFTVINGGKPGAKGNKSNAKILV
jgi:hypothetical protein